MPAPARARIKAIFSTWVFLTATPSVAQDVHRPITPSCIEQSGGVTSVMLDCLSKSYEEIDNQLNQAWSALLPALDAAQRKSFRDAQRIWINYRNTTCTAEASLQAGSFASVAQADCQVRLTAERLHWLEQILPEHGGLETR